MTRRDARSGERGSALIVVLVALLILTPLALVLSTLSMKYQRDTTTFRDTLRARYAVRGGLDMALGRLRSEPRMSVGNERGFELTESVPLPVSVRMTREADVVVGLEGKLLRARDVSGLDLGAIGFDAERRQFRRYRPLELYVVQAETPGSLGNPAIRLVASVAKTDDGELIVLGTRYDKALFGGAR